MDYKYDLIIVGGGPAGLTAGIYAARGGLKTVIIGAMPGGQAALTEKIENYAGFEPVDGITLTSKMQAQAEGFGVEYVYATVIDFDLEQKCVTTEDGDVYRADALILAMGAKSRKLDLEGEDLLVGQGVSYCATCDGGFYRGKTVAVVGGGDTALTDALYLSNLAKKVYLIHRRQGFRAAKILVDRIKESGVELVLDATVTELIGAPLRAIRVKNVVDGSVREIEADGIFIAVGTVPNTEGLKGLRLENGYIPTDARMQTELEGVYAAGDIRVTPLRQVITACADGAVAAESAIHRSLTTK